MFMVCRENMHCKVSTTDLNNIFILGTPHHEGIKVSENSIRNTGNQKRVIEFSLLFMSAKDASIVLYLGMIVLGLLI